MSGRMIAIVGPSGVGKDSVMRGIAAAAPRLHLVRRVITRPTDRDSEDFDSVDPATFTARQAAGDFALSWSAHGLCYGIPAQVDAALGRGDDLLVNLSRGVLDQAAARFVALTVIALTAEPAVLAQRLAARGREDAAGIAARLARSDARLPASVGALTLDNSGALADTVRRAIDLIYPARVTL